MSPLHETSGAQLEESECHQPVLFRPSTGYSNNTQRPDPSNQGDVGTLTPPLNEWFGIQGSRLPSLFLALSRRERKVSVPNGTAFEH
jgi:hypothetical protein